MVTEEVSVEVDSEDVDTPWRKGLLSAVGHAVRLRHDATLSWRNDVLPVRIDADAEDASVVMSVLVIFFFFFEKFKGMLLRCYQPRLFQLCCCGSNCHSFDW